MTQKPVSQNRRKFSQTAPTQEKEPSQPVEQVDNQSIFDERYKLFMDQFGAECERQNVQIAIALVVDPQSPQEPMAFMRGPVYECTALLAEAVRRLKSQIDYELDTNPR